MDEETFLISFPSFTLFSQDGRPLVCKMEGKTVVSLFTDLDSAKSYVEKCQRPCNVTTLPTPDELARFMASFKEDILVAMDPLDDQMRTITCYQASKVLDAIAKKRFTYKSNS
jgi:hypothetical protein